MPDQPEQPELPYSTDDPDFDHWEEQARLRREELEQALERIRDQLDERQALAAARAAELDPVVLLPSGLLKFASELTHAEEVRGGIRVRSDLQAPPLDDELLDEDGQPYPF